MYISYLFAETKVEEHLKKVWGEEFELYMKEVIKGFSYPLQSIENQLQSVCYREGFLPVVGFDLTFYSKKVDVEIAIAPRIRDNYTENGHPIMFFYINHRSPLSFPYQLLLEGNKDGTTLGTVENTADGLARRISSDLARDGLPSKMKEIIIIIGRVVDFAGGTGGTPIRGGKWEEIIIKE